MKKFIIKSWNVRALDENKLARALLQYRNTPTQMDGASPAQKLYGHPIQDTIPVHNRAFAPEWQKRLDCIDQKRNASIESSKTYYDVHSRKLPDLLVGTQVAVQNAETGQWDVYGVVFHIDRFRKYLVKTKCGRILERNRRFLKKRNIILPIEETTQIIQNDNDVSETESYPRRTRCSHVKPQRLIEDPNWP